MKNLCLKGLLIILSLYHSSLQTRKIRDVDNSLVIAKDERERRTQGTAKKDQRDRALTVIKQFFMGLLCCLLSHFVFCLLDSETF